MHQIRVKNVFRPLYLDDNSYEEYYVQESRYDW